MAWRDLLKRHGDADPDPLDDVLANQGEPIGPDLRKLYRIIEAEGFTTVENLRAQGPIAIGTHEYWYGTLLPKFRTLFPDDVVRSVGGVTVDGEAAVEAGYLTLGRGGERHRTAEAFDAHAVDLLENARFTDKDAAVWQLQYLYRMLADSSSGLHDYEVVYGANLAVPTIVGKSDPYPAYLRRNDGTEYRDLVANGEWGPFERIRYDLLTELPGFVDAGEYYLATPDAEPPVEAAGTEEVAADAD